MSAMICFVLWIAVIGEKASKYRDDRRYRDLTQNTVRSCLIMSSQQDGTWAAVPTNLYHMTTPDPVEPELVRQRYECKDCDTRFDDLTDTIFARHHQPLKVWVLCLYFMGLNVSNEQIAKELDVHLSDVQQMTTQLREGMVKKTTIR